MVLEPHLLLLLAPVLVSQPLLTLAQQVCLEAIKTKDLDLALLEQERTLVSALVFQLVLV